MALLKNILSVLPIISLIYISSVFALSNEGMASMPQIKPKQSSTIQDVDSLESQKGFGDQAPQVRMMNLMMIEGSGIEGMNMKTMSMNDKASDQTSKPMTESNIPYEIEAKSLINPPKTGSNLIEFSIHNSKDKKPVKNLKFKVQVYMLSMDMGTEEPAVKDIGMGKYQVKAPFAMQGPWAVKLIFPDQTEKIFNFNVQSSK